jgi:hypothetical protein
MATYTKTSKVVSTYTKTDKSELHGHLKSPWFFGWFKGVEDYYHKVSKLLATYTKVDRS